MQGGETAHALAALRIGDPANACMQRMVPTIAALAARAFCAPTPTAVSSDCVAKFRTTALQKRCGRPQGRGRGARRSEDSSQRGVNKRGRPRTRPACSTVQGSAVVTRPLSLPRIPTGRTPFAQLIQSALLATTTPSFPSAQEAWPSCPLEHLRQAPLEPLPVVAGDVTAVRQKRCSHRAARVGQVVQQPRCACHGVVS
jgi:hypothetical protein